jgi:pyrimidine-specific ribonucleoside hydrolase
MQKRKIIISLFLAIYFFYPLSARIYNVIIDTDCAFDDMRAIGILLSHPDVRLKGIVVTEGTLLPEEGFVKVKSLLHEFRLDTITVAAGKTYNRPAPPWRYFNQTFQPADYKVKESAIPDAIPWLEETLVSSTTPVIYICLGPLTTLAEILTNKPSLKSKISRVIWYNESIEPPDGFNYNFDKPSADSVIAMRIRTDIISNLNNNDAFWDSTIYLNKNINTNFARFLSLTGGKKKILENQNRHHLRIADELAAIYLINPELFDITVLYPKVFIRYNRNYDLASVKELFADIIKGSYSSESNIVFSAFPAQRGMFTYDVRKIMDSVITKYGYEEWKACVITDEFHGHLGVFSIVGAKMGIKARELFGVGPDKLMVTTYAGTMPPYSCLNDGIQVSTGATIGQGLITVVDDGNRRPEAIFTLNNKSYRLSLKDEYLQLITHDIEEGITNFGLTDDGYWKLVRRAALRYWLEWDRNVIFNIELINNL